MKKLGKVSSYVFAALALVALAAAITGAMHQLALTGLCAAMAWVMYPQNNSKSLKNQ